MISKSKGIIFFDITKTGGTSVIESLSDAIPDCAGKHHTVQNIAAHRPYSTHISEDELADFFKFTFVRDPYDRLVSCYLWGQSDYHPFYKGMSFIQFVDYALEEEHELDEHLRLMPMHKWLMDVNGDLRVDFIGRYENLQEDYDRLCDLICVPRSRLGVINTGVHHSGRVDSYESYYDDNTRRKVGELYALDFELFSYIRLHDI